MFIVEYPFVVGLDPSNLPRKLVVKAAHSIHAHDIDSTDMCGPQKKQLHVTDFKLLLNILKSV